MCRHKYYTPQDVGTRIMSNTVSCRICNKQYKRITHKHLKQHGTSLSEYTDMYPDAPLITESLRSSFASNSEAAWVKKHGEEKGKRLYAEYKIMLAEKNTFEYKRDKYGWTRDQFDAYNNKRATTLANMIERYGEIDGRTKWDMYRAQQAIAGVSELWFVNKYGAEVGQQMWAAVFDISSLLCILKSPKLYCADFAVVIFMQFKTRAMRMESDNRYSVFISVFPCLIDWISRRTA